jgi:hypothetical protein
MSPLIEEARRRQRRRRAALALVVLVLAGVGAAGFGTRHHGSPTQSSSVSYSVETVASGMVIRPRSSDGRSGAAAPVTNAAVARALKRGQRVTTEVRLDPKTGAVEVRLTTSH